MFFKVYGTGDGQNLVSQPLDSKLLCEGYVHHYNGLLRLSRLHLKYYLMWVALGRPDLLLVRFPREVLSPHLILRVSLLFTLGFMKHKLRAHSLARPEDYSCQYTKDSKISYLTLPDSSGRYNLTICAPQQKQKVCRIR